MNAPAFLRKHAGLGSLLANLSSAGALFLIFRLAYHQLGPAVVGVWALLQGIMLISKLPDMGSASNTTRLVAIEVAATGSIRLRNFLAAGLVVNTLPIIAIGLLIYFPTYAYTKASAQHSGIPLSTLSLFIWQSLTFGVLTSLSSLISGCLDGLGLMALRGYLSCIANLIFVVLAYVLINRLGDEGLGFAYVGYAVILVILCALALAMFQPNGSEKSGSKTVFELVRASIGFNLNFLLIGILRLLLDPICKILINSFSTLDAVALFDLANKVTVQIRLLYSSTLQSLLPLVSREGHTLSVDLHKALLQWNRIVSRWSLYTMSIAVLLSSALSRFSLGRVDHVFVLQFIVLALGNALNTLGLVGYYTEMGSGHLRRLLRLHLEMAAINVALGLLLGKFIGATGVIIAYSCALAYGVACAHTLFGRWGGLAAFLYGETRTEFALFAASAVVAWLTSEDFSGLSLSSRYALAGFSALLVAAVFFYRERQEIAARFVR